MKEKHVQTEMIFIHHLFVSRHMDNENHRTPSGDGIPHCPNTRWPLNPYAPSFRICIGALNADVVLKQANVSLETKHGKSLIST